MVMALFASCSDFLDIESPTTVRTDAYFKSTSDFTSAVSGVYNGLRSYYGNFYEVAELPSDNAQINGYNLGVAPLDQLTWITSTASIQNRWTISYALVARANVVEARLTNFEMEKALKDQYLGEVRFIRALMYFNLVQFFGDVPLVVKEITSENEAYSYKRSPVAEIYAQVERDLLSAVELLPDAYNAANAGRITKGAARSLLGKVYVTNKQFDKAVPVLKSVVASDQYKLLPQYASVFDIANKNNAEMVFAVQYLGGTGFSEGSNFSILFAPFGSGTEITSGGIPASANGGTLDLFNAFEAGDLRKPVSIAFWPTTDSLYYTRKFLDKPVASNEGKNDWPVIRYSDVLLLLSEAYNETGTVSDALPLINAVRKRAGLANLSGLDQAALRSAIQHERRVELCFEGHRWFDLLRTGTMLSTMRAYKEKYIKYGGYLVPNYEVTDAKVRFPVPFRELSLNPELGQNDGY
ncbi:RagB/SusD family nutrient uptake outer membrane protein [Ravibacter arvi]|uniref:RagB/SusD family nutrient uptake outer membrane protein n=2 Tax=Ravibacter arvi TaxID=2051041 RepID=A0ABP8LVB5_9BACT